MALESWKVQPFKYSRRGVSRAQPFINEPSAITTSRNQLGVSRIQKTVSRTGLGVARVQQTLIKTQAGVSRLKITSSANIIGKSRVQTRPSRNQLGIASVRKATNRAQLGKSSILKTTTNTTQGRSFMVQNGGLIYSSFNDYLSSYWSLDEGANVERQDIINGLDLFEVNNPVVGGGGAFGDGANFDGSGFLRTDPCANSAQDFSISFWFQLNDFGFSQVGTQRFVSKDGEYEIFMEDTTLSFRVYCQGDFVGLVQSAEECILDTLYFCCVSFFPNGDMTMFLNGRSASGGVDEGTRLRLLETSNFSVGDNVRGFIDELAFFNRALTLGEAAAIYNNGSGQIYPFQENAITVTRKQNAISRIKKLQNGTTQGKAAIRNLVTKNEQGKSRIQISSDGSISGHSRIQVKTNQAIGGVARIEKTTKDKSILGVARIKKSVSSSILGKARIQRTRDEAQAGYSRIQTVSETNIRGLARIRNFVNATSLGLSRIQIVSTKGISGRAMIVLRNLKTMRGRANILNPNSLPVIRVSKDSVRNASNKVGVNSLQSAVNTTETGTSANGSNTETDVNLTNSETTVKLTVIT